MNPTITQDRPSRKPVPAEQQVAPLRTPANPAAPTLDSIVQAICLDANHDSLKFVLRSDTGHDGE